MQLLLVLLLSLGMAQQSAPSKANGKKGFQKLRSNAAVVKGKTSALQKEIDEPAKKNIKEEKCRETKTLDGTFTRTCTVYEFDKPEK